MAELQRRGRVSRVGVVLCSVAALWLLLAPVLGHMGRPWPCFIAGLLLLMSLAMAWRRPEQRRGWSVFVMVLSTTILLVGTSAIPPALLGLAGGVLMIVWSNEPEAREQA